LDLFTIKQEFSTFDNLIVTICGDIKSSRVAKSNITALGKLGVKVLLTGPDDLLPKPEEIPSHCEIVTLDDAIEVSDVVMLLRIQHERHETFELSTKDYTEQFGLNDRRIKMMKRNAIIMHPGPVNRDVEIQSHLVEHTQSRIFKQMENGVYSRMAILDWIYS
jgi:aspartate carbamoyltransferase catalytic subunit